jgi:hypothetical protein
MIATGSFREWRCARLASSRKTLTKSPPRGGAGTIRPRNRHVELLSCECKREETSERGLGCADIELCFRVLQLSLQRERARPGCRRLPQVVEWQCACHPPSRLSSSQSALQVLSVFIAFTMEGDDGPVMIPYSLLLSPDACLTPLIRRAFSSSPSSLGLVIISDLPPAFPALRLRLLLLSNAFASLPESTCERYADPSTQYSYGWSCGKEIMNGKPDKLKGSFYNNPSYDESPGLLDDTVHKNIWPQEEGCEGYEEAFKELCALMVSVGGLVARACDAIVVEGDQGLASTKSVEELVTRSRSNKARLLHYVC